MSNTGQVKKDIIKSNKELELLQHKLLQKVLNLPEDLTQYIFNFMHQIDFSECLHELVHGFRFAVAWVQVARSNEITFSLSHTIYNYNGYNRGVFLYDLDMVTSYCDFENGRRGVVEAETIFYFPIWVFQPRSKFTKNGLNPLVEIRQENAWQCLGVDMDREEYRGDIPLFDLLTNY